MAARSYWLNLFSIGTWQEFLDAGASVTGFRENRWSQTQLVASKLAETIRRSIKCFRVKGMCECQQE